MNDQKIEFPTHSDKEQTYYVHDTKNSELEQRDIFYNICGIYPQESKFAIDKYVVDFDEDSEA